MNAWALSRRLTTLACSFVVLFTCGTAAADTILPWVKTNRASPGQAKFQIGLSALHSGDLNAAEAAFRESLQLDPKTVGSALGLAQIALKKGNTVGAAAFLEQALTIAPDSAEAQLNWGRFQYAKGNPTEARSALQKAVSLDGSSVVPRIDLGDLYLNAFHKPGEAIEQYRAALKLAPQHAGAHYALGVALATERHWEEAKAELVESAKLSPNNPLPSYTLGRVFIETNQGDQALEAFNAALKSQPRFLPAMMERGSLFMSKNEDERAVADFRAVLSIEPKSADAYVKLGMIRQRRGRMTEAEAAYLSAVKINERHALAYNNLAWMAAERHVKTGEAVMWAEKAVALAPKVPDFQDTLAWVYRARGDLKGAESALLRVAATSPERADFFYHLGVVQHELGKKREAASDFRRALSLDGNFSDAGDARRRLAEYKLGPDQ
jgi:Tfp pilus assembly protein PilF